MSSFTSHSRMPALLRVFAIVALVTGSFVAVAQAAPGRGGGHGKPGDDPSASPTGSPTDDGHGRGHGRGGGEREGRPGQTRLKLRLTSHHFESGSDVTGTVGLQTRTENKWGPLSGEIVVFVDRTETGSVTTSAEDGKAEVAIPGLADGGHVVRVHYAGDATHRPARHAQGLYVGTPPECEKDKDDEAAADDDAFEDEEDDDDSFFAPRHGEGPKDGHGGHGRGRGRGKGKPKDDRPPCPKDDETTTTDDDAAKEEDDEDGDEDDDDDDGVDTTGDDSQDTGDEDTDDVSAEDSIDTTGDTGETIE